jgi:hypothetical protein
VDNRKDCKEVTVLENITKNVKTSTMFNETEHLIQEMFVILVTLDKIERPTPDLLKNRNE